MSPQTHRCFPGSEAPWQKCPGPLLSVASDPVIMEVDLVVNLTLLGFGLAVFPATEPLSWITSVDQPPVLLLALQV